MRHTNKLLLPLIVALPLACSSEARQPVKASATSVEEPPPEPPSEFIEDAHPKSNEDEDEIEGVCIPHPKRFDIPDNDCDDDDDGEVDNPPAACDGSLAVDGDALAFARSLGLCQTLDDPDEDRWGVVSASYRRGHNQAAPPAPGQHGILSSFGLGLRPREGSSFGILSTGWARLFNTDGPEQTSFKEGSPMQSFGLGGGGGKLPPGFPKAGQGCPTTGEPYDIASLRLEIKTPRNAKGFQFDFTFYSGEWPEWVCTRFNDGFIAYLKSEAFKGGQGDNMSFDGTGSPVSVNNAFFDRCTPDTPLGCSGTSTLLPTQLSTCPGLENELLGTGFEAYGVYCGEKQSTGGGATGWLTSQAPIKGGETIELEFYIWDSGDGGFDSSVILDNFRWIPKEVTAGTDRPR